jgi:hypothetical protein
MHCGYMTPRTSRRTFGAPCTLFFLFNLGAIIATQRSLPDDEILLFSTYIGDVRPPIIPPPPKTYRMFFLYLHCLAEVLPDAQCCHILPAAGVVPSPGQTMGLQRKKPLLPSVEKGWPYRHLACDLVGHLV